MRFCTPTCFERAGPTRVRVCADGSGCMSETGSGMGGFTTKVTLVTTSAININDKQKTSRGGEGHGSDVLTRLKRESLCRMVNQVECRDAVAYGAEERVVLGRCVGATGSGGPRTGLAGSEEDVATFMDRAAELVEFVGERHAVSTRGQRG